MSTALARQGSHPVGLQDWQLLREQAGVLLASGFLPAHIKTPEAAITIMLKGRELEIPPLHALSNIAVVNGKPTCNAELMLALVKRDLGRDALRVVETTADHCTVEYQDGTHVGTFTFSAAEARTAGLWGKVGPWTQFPAAMLRARCISAACRFVFPDVLGGMYTPEELGAAVTLTEQGDLEIEAPPPARPAPPPAEPPAASGAPLPIQTIGDFWLAAQALLQCKASQTASLVRDRLGQEAGAYQHAHGLAWSNVYTLLEANLRDGEPIPGAPPSLAGLALAPEDRPTGPEETLPCEQCGGTLHEIRFRDGTSWQPADLAALGQRKHGKRLCMPCYRKANADRLAADRGAEVVEA